MGIQPGTVEIVAVSCIFSVPILWMFCHYLTLGVRSWREISLKQQMVERGYSAQEIAQILGASSVIDEPPTPNPVVKPSQSAI
jgi:hypothetical protein